MPHSIYKASDSSMLTRDDLITWLRTAKSDPRFKDWDFNAITGGIDEFFEPQHYYEMKEFYEKYLEK